MAQFSLGQAIAGLGLLERKHDRENLETQRALQEKNRKETQQIDGLKWSIGQLTDQYDSTSSLAMRDNIVKTLQGLVSGIKNPKIKQAAAPYIMAGPLNPLKQQMHLYEKTYPRPKVTADIDSDPRLYVQQQFGVLDYATNQKEFATKLKQPKENLVHFSNSKGSFIGIRNDQGLVNLLTSEEAGLVELAKQHGTTVAGLVKNPWREGGGTIVRTGATAKIVKSKRNIITNEQQTIAEDVPFNYEPPITRDGGKATWKFPKSVPGGLQSLRTAWTTGDDDNSLMKALLEVGKRAAGKEIGWKMFAGGKQLNTATVKARDSMIQFLEGSYPGWSFQITGEAADPWLGAPYFTPGKDANLLAIPGKKVPVFLEGIGTLAPYYDRVNDTIYGDDGHVIGSMEEFQLKVLQEFAAKQAKPLVTVVPTPVVPKPRSPQAILERARKKREVRKREMKKRTFRSPSR